MQRLVRAPRRLLGGCLAVLLVAAAALLGYRSTFGVWPYGEVGEGRISWCDRDFRYAGTVGSLDAVAEAAPGHTVSEAGTHAPLGGQQVHVLDPPSAYQRDDLPCTSQVVLARADGRFDTYTLLGGP